MPAPEAILEAMREALGAEVRALEPVGGGCIAHASRAETTEGTFFVKWGREAGVTFEAEAAGLRALRDAASPLHVPEVHHVQPTDGARPGVLVLEWLPTAPTTPAAWTHFGEGLAALHRHAGDAYGFTMDNYIGRRRQSNRAHPRWPDFFRAERLLPQAAWAQAEGRWRAGWDAGFEALCRRLDALLPEAPPPSMLHGDLWSGNFLVTPPGRAALVDPAAYHGHRETDLAMTELFGGFDERFYAAYRAAWPLEPGYAERRTVYNLYHLLNHLNHFGDAYAGGVERTLRRYR